MIWFLKAFWRSLTFVGTLVGLVFLASDTFDIASAMAGWRRVFSMFSQNTALWIFALAALAYIIWIDARPFVTKWRRGERRELSVLPNVLWKAGPGIEVDGTHYHPNDLYIVLYNAGRSGRAARRVRVRTGVTDQKPASEAISGQLEVDIQHGEYAEFYLGRMITKKGLGWMDLSAKATDVDIAEATHNTARGNISLRYRPKGALYLSAESMRGPNSNTLDVFSVVVSADGMPAMRVRLKFHHDRAVSTDHGAGPPVTIESVTQV